MYNLKKVIYLDNAATTPAFPAVSNEIAKYFSYQYGNPSSIYSIGKENKKAIELARKRVANLIGALPEEIFFTSGGSESDNWAIKSSVFNSAYTIPHIITSRIEHHAVINTCKDLEKLGAEVTYLTVDSNGMINLDELRESIRKNTVLISIMYANNEIGTIEPVYEIAEIAQNHNVLFHTDAVQACGQIPINVKELNVDYLSGSGHKFNGPKGVGFLYVSNKTDIGPLLCGGGQEMGKRAGTENVPGIVGIGIAAKITQSILSKKIEEELFLRDYIINRFYNEIPCVKLNGDRDKRLPNNVNVSFEYIEGDNLLLLLDEAGICASSGSACNSSSGSSSHVLEAIGVSDDLARGALRITLGHDTNRQEIDYAIEKIKQIVGELRKGSLEFEKYR